jgi:flagellar protein FlbD
VIPVTCRNGEHFSIDPDAIERVETRNDTVVHMVDGAKYVVDISLDELVVAVRDHRAAGFVARHRLVDGYAGSSAAVPAAGRHIRRARGGDSAMAFFPDRSER